MGVALAGWAVLSLPWALLLGVFFAGGDVDDDLLGDV